MNARRISNSHETDGGHGDDGDNDFSPFLFNFLPTYPRQDVRRDIPQHAHPLPHLPRGLRRKSAPPVLRSGRSPVFPLWWPLPRDPEAVSGHEEEGVSGGYPENKELSTAIGSPRNTRSTRQAPDARVDCEPGMGYFFAGGCVAMICPLLLSEVTGGTTCFCTSSSFRC